MENLLWYNFILGVCLFNIKIKIMLRCKESWLHEGEFRHLHRILTYWRSGRSRKRKIA